MESVAFPRFYFPIRFWCELERIMIVFQIAKIPASYQPEHFRRSLTGSLDCYLAASLSGALAF